jgi:release factor glutamine methyltransferase
MNTQDPWTTRRLLDWMNRAFVRQGLDAPRLGAEILLSHVLGVERLKLYTDPDRQATPDELVSLRALVARALRNEPIQYLTGEAWFFGLPFRVDARVLIPRPCTETLVETVLAAHRSSRRARRPATAALPGDQPGADQRTPALGAGAPAHDEQHTVHRPAPVRIADVCTGSGCIAVAIARHLPDARITATDLSPEALEVARTNAVRHGVEDQIDLLEGDLLEPLRHSPDRYDWIVANPPYIPDDEWNSPDPSIGVGESVRRHEPPLALRAGPDALRLVRPLIAVAPALLKPGGRVMIELASRRAEAALNEARGVGAYAECRLIRDLEGHQRFLFCQIGA